MTRVVFIREFTYNTTFSSTTYQTKLLPIPPTI